MISLDTNVVSELWKPHPAPAVVAWFNTLQPADVWLTATVLSELCVGIERLPAGRRSAGLRRVPAGFLGQVGDRIAPFDTSAARLYGRLVSQAALNGVVVGRADGEIAACAVLHGHTVATRDVLPFEAMDVPVVSPWAPTPG